MIYNVLNYLEESACCYPDKTAVIDEQGSCSYAELQDCCKRIGTGLSSKIKIGMPVIAYMEKGMNALGAFFGIVYAGGFYSLLSPELPKTRLAQMKSVLQAEVVITDREHQAAAEEIFSDAKIVLIEELKTVQIEEEVLTSIRQRSIDGNPLYVNFTSGSTGTPKGIAVSHRSVIDFIGCFTELFSITKEDVIANQAPFDFDVSVKDIYSAMRTGATLVILPRRLFSAPAELIDALCQYKITTMIWAVSALCLISICHGLDYKTPETIKKVLFSGEVMPYKHLNNWREHLPEAQFVNLYGPTEITCNCTYHILEPERDYKNGIPIGIPFPNENVFLLDEGDQKVREPETIGEICVRGTALALGYYRSPEQTAACFVQNPVNTAFPERIYRTGDLGRYSENRELYFSGRKDFQVKYMGHRIELEEVEGAMSAIDGVERCRCTFDTRRSKLKGYYVGTVEKDALHAILQQQLPVYMIPGQLKRLEAMPLTKNGKIDVTRLEEGKAK
ncbi:MAG: amino acid adenylation domain-containing protein [Lachnospiraceae bacterium]|nr:amino acid adenylation domain-containing protein [Lachnospiraceae bacterium]